MKNFKHFLLLGGAVLALSSCGEQVCRKVYVDDGLIHITFDTCLNLKTTNIKEQIYEEAHKVKKPTVVIIDENPDNLALYGWYKDRNFETPWDFKKDIAEESMTLYAKFISQYEVNYYQGISENDISLLGTELVFKGDTVPEREDLPDCYENPENCYLVDIKTNEDGKTSGTKVADTPVQYNVDVVDGPKNILLRRSEEFYLSGPCIKRRFAPVAATLGQNGSLSGSITVEKDNNNENYARIDFGTISKKEKVVDPYIIMDNPQIDVTNSQYIDITMMNVGIGTSLSFYWVGKWKVNGQWINGKEYHSFNEDRSFKFAVGTGTNNLPGGMVYKDVNDKKYVNNQNENDYNWITYRLPIAEKINNGVSTWGCAGKITALRIQSSFAMPSNPAQDITGNVLCIKSIKGVKVTDKTYDFIDSPTYNTLKTDDSAESVSTAASQQTQVNGFIFPKNNNSIVTTPAQKDSPVTTTNIYKKTDGTIFTGEYKDGAKKIVLKPSTSFDVGEFPTLNLSYRNYGYFNSLTLTFNLKVGNNIKKLYESISIETLMSESKVLKHPMAEVSGFEGILDSLEIDFTPVGIDNILKIEKIEFTDYESKAVDGYNFDKKDFDGFTSAGSILSYDKAERATKVTTTASNKSLSKNVVFDTTIMKGFDLTFKNPSNSISKIIVTMNVKGSEKSFNINDVNTGDRFVTKQVLMNTTSRGEISNITISFEGVGEIFLKSLVWSLVDESLNLSNGDFYNNNIKHIGGAYDKYNYDSEERALYTATNSAPIYGRLGAWGYKIDGKDIVNISMAGKTKIAVMYQNRATGSDSSNQYLSFGAVLKADDGSHLTAEATPNSAVTINSVSKKPTGSTRLTNHKKGMNSGEWAVETIELDSFYTTTENECYLTMFYFQTATQKKNIYVRAFALI